MKSGEEKLVDCYSVIVGLNDKDTNSQKFEMEKYVRLIEFYCQTYGISFSVQRTNGGYVYANGRYTRENSLTVLLIDSTKEQADAMGAELCALFNQETVLITHEKIGMYYLSEEIGE